MTNMDFWPFRGDQIRPQTKFYSHHGPQPVGVKRRQPPTRQIEHWPGSPLKRALKWGTPFSLAKILPIISHNLETGKIGGKFVKEVLYELSISTKIGELEWPWTA